MGNEIRKFEPPADDSIRTLWHDGSTLRVHYRGGGMYDYDDVSTDMFDGLMQSKARAKFIIDRIRPDRDAKSVSPGTPFPRLAWD